MKNDRYCPLTYSPYNPTIHPFTQQYILTLTYREKNRKRKVSKMKVSIQFPVYSSLYLLLCFCLFGFFCFVFFKTEFPCVALAIIELTL